MSTTTTTRTLPVVEQYAALIKSQSDPHQGQSVSHLCFEDKARPSIDPGSGDELPPLIDSPNVKYIDDKTPTPTKKAQVTSDSEDELDAPPRRRYNLNKVSPYQDFDSSARVNHRDLSGQTLTAVSPDHVDSKKTGVRFETTPAKSPYLSPPRSNEKDKTSPATSSRTGQDDTPTKKATPIKEDVFFNALPYEMVCVPSEEESPTPDKTTYKAAFPIASDSTFKIPALDTRNSLIMSTMDLIVRYDNHFHRTEYSNKLLREAKTKAEKEIEGLNFTIKCFGKEEELFRSDMDIANQRIKDLQVKLDSQENAKKDLAMMRGFSSSYEGLENRLKDAIDRCESQKKEISHLEAKMDELEKINFDGICVIDTYQNADAEDIVNRKVCTIEDCNTQFADLEKELLRANEKVEEQTEQIEKLRTSMELWQSKRDGVEWIEDLKIDEDALVGLRETRELLMLREQIKMLELKEDAQEEHQDETVQLRQHIETLESELKEKCRQLEEVRNEDQVRDHMAQFQAELDAAEEYLVKAKNEADLHKHHQKELQAANKTIDELKADIEAMRHRSGSSSTVRRESNATDEKVHLETIAQLKAEIYELKFLAADSQSNGRREFNEQIRRDSTIEELQTEIEDLRARLAPTNKSSAVESKQILDSIDAAHFQMIINEKDAEIEKLKTPPKLKQHRDLVLEDQIATSPIVRKLMEDLDLLKKEISPKNQKHFDAAGVVDAGETDDEDDVGERFGGHRAHDERFHGFANIRRDIGATAV